MVTPFAEMVKIGLYPLSESEFVGIINNQSFNNLKGGSIEDINIFRASKRHLHGSGFLDVFSKIGKFIMPAVKKYVVPAALDYSHGVMKDVAKGKNIRHSLKRRGTQSLKKVGSRILHGKGVSKKQKPSKRVRKRKKNQHLKGTRGVKRKATTKHKNKPSKKRKHCDIFS